MEVHNKAFLKQQIILVQVFFLKICSRHSFVSPSSLTQQYLKVFFSTGAKEEIRQAIIVLPPLDLLHGDIIVFTQFSCPCSVPILQGDFFHEKLTIVIIIGLGESPVPIPNVLVVLGS